VSQRVRGDIRTELSFKDPSLDRVTKGAQGTKSTAWENYVEGQSGDVLSKRGGHKGVGDRIEVFNERVTSA